MKNQFLTACAIGMIASLSYASNGFAAPLITHESTGSIATSALTTTVTGGTIGSVSTVSGTVTSATSLTINVGPDVVFSSATGGINVTIPTGTTIVSSSGAAFDATAILATGAIVSSGLSTNEVSNGAIEFGISSVGLNFSKPIKIEIPVPGYVGATIAMKVKHGGTSTFVTTGLTNDPNATCTNGVPSIVSSTATVASGIATIYTCAASTFVAVSTTTSSTTTTGGGGGSYVALPTSTAIISTPTTTTPVKKTVVRKVFVKKTSTKKTKVSMVGAEKYTKSSRVNIRAAGDFRAKFLGYFTKDTKVVVVSESGNWTEVKTDKITGWVMSTQLRDASSGELEMLVKEAMRVPPYDQVTAIGRVNVWSAPTTKSKFLGYMGSKVKVTVTEKDATGWVKITSKYYNGWVKASMLKDL